ncbi:MAG TPA: alpha/beta hydrolase [Candidatus Eisenbacteria bacterium]|nr:alpha/beta hydrolase [Candidatus Eisenbacteria bacterium]
MSGTDPLDELSRAVSDGAAVDWDRAESDEATVGMQLGVRALRDLERIAAFSRSHRRPSERSRAASPGAAQEGSVSRPLGVGSIAPSIIDAIRDRGTGMSPKTIVFVHGNFVTRHCWDRWVERYSARGHRCVAIAYPLRDESVGALRAKHPDPALGRLGLREVVEHHVNVIRSLGEKPVVIGHSFGGFLTQLLMQRDVAAAGVAIDSVPVQGVISLEWSFARSLFPVFNPLVSRTKPYLMSFPEFQYTFVNGMPFAAQREAYDREVVPESRVLASGALGAGGRVDFKRDRPPLLMIAGSDDHIMPASLNRANFERYKASPAVTSFKEFPGRNHYLIGAPGWEEVADFAVDWALAHARDGASRESAGATEVTAPAAP